jgi:hypothetical protein
MSLPECLPFHNNTSNGLTAILSFNNDGITWADFSLVIEPDDLRLETVINVKNN